MNLSTLSHILCVKFLQVDAFCDGSRKDRYLLCSSPHHVTICVYAWFDWNIPSHSDIILVGIINLL